MLECSLGVVLKNDEQQHFVGRIDLRHLMSILRLFFHPLAHAWVAIHDSWGHVPLSSHVYDA